MSSLWVSKWAPKRPTQQVNTPSTTGAGGMYTSIRPERIPQQTQRPPSTMGATATSVWGSATQSRSNQQSQVPAIGLQGSRWALQHNRDSIAAETATGPQPSGTHAPPLPIRKERSKHGLQESIWAQPQQQATFEEDGGNSLIEEDDQYDADSEDFGISNKDAEAIAQCYDSDIEMHDRSPPAVAPAPPSPEPVNCTICLDPLGTCGGPQALSCGHVFCGGCISGWLHEQASCPQCRSLVVDHESYYVGGASVGGRRRGGRGRRRRCRN